VKVPVRWVVPEGMLTLAPTNIVVQYIEGEFIISLFEGRPPILLGSKEEVFKQLKTHGEIPVYCLARFVLSPQRMEDFVRVVGENLQRYKQSLEQKGGDIAGEGS
jgi:hypothetical protein